MGALYQKGSTIKSLYDYFQPYIKLLTRPSGKKLFLILLAMISMQLVTSIRHVYKWFLSDICGLSLNAFYHLMSYTDIQLNAFLQVTVRLALGLVSKEAHGLPICLIIDDTLLAKFGTHFECYQTMFDHAKHNGSNYLKGHCFVALTISIPIITGKGISYLNIPVGFRLRGEKENKLEIASKMIDEAMTVLADYPMTILLCDSWYPKGAILKTVARYKNLALNANVRVDTSIFNLPPPKTGKRGRPKEQGDPIDIHTDLNFTRIEDYFIATKEVLTNLFKEAVYLTVTATDLSNYKSYRVFISTLLPEDILKQLAAHERNLPDRLDTSAPWLIPLQLYSFRWGIEICFYEMKSFWSFGLYMLRGKRGIENFVNVLSIAYACMKMLPFRHTKFSVLAVESTQTAKYTIGEAIKREIFLAHFISEVDLNVNSDELFNTLNQCTRFQQPNKVC